MQVEVAFSLVVILIFNYIETAVKTQYLYFCISALVTKNSGDFLFV